ncbi:ABC transporter permease [Marinicrinis sediminis]|uniref:ABC transporter permease n=1 Tax=Marinicrinis sediminis TaxID=1652465 RepID=A0ABW5RC54_9BACL
MEFVQKRFMKGSTLTPLVAVFLGLLVGAVIMLLGGYDPLLAYRELIQRVVGSTYHLGETAVRITPLILTGLSVAFAFRTGLFNIGAEGQLMVGMTAATFMGIQVSLPWFAHIPLAIGAGGLAGGLWGALAGWLKASRGVNEVIATIMLNWIAIFGSSYVVRSLLLEPGQQRSYYIEESASVLIQPLYEATRARLHWGTVLALLAAFVFYILLWRTRQGYELRAVGHNQHAAEYAGMKVGRNIVKAMFVAGVFAGLAGVFEVLGVFGYQVAGNSSPGYGFDGIAVALLGMNRPFGVILAAILFGVLTYGAGGMEFGADVPPEIIRVVIGSVIFFVAAPGIVQTILKRLRIRRMPKEAN